MSLGRHGPLTAVQCPSSSEHRLNSRAVPVNTEAIGKTYPPDIYAVGREKIREYASAVGETNPLYFDVDAARAAGYADVVAPPMFAVVYAGRSITPALFDPDVGIDYANMLHASQEFTWGPLVVAGDEIATTTVVKDVSERGGMGFYEFETDSRNQRGETVCIGVWRELVRGATS
jgi:acyl dehydratase